MAFQKVHFATVSLEDAAYHQSHPQPQGSHQLWTFDAGETIEICFLKVCPLRLRLVQLCRNEGSLLVDSHPHLEHRYYLSAAGLFQVLRIRQYLEQTASQAFCAHSRFKGAIISRQ